MAKKKGVRGTIFAARSKIDDAIVAVWRTLCWSAWAAQLPLVSGSQASPTFLCSPNRPLDTRIWPRTNLS